MTPEAREQATEHVMDAIAANSEQHRLIVNATPEIDSIAEHAERLIRLTQGEARAHACDILKLAAAVQQSNRAEAERVRAIPPLLEDRTRWGVKKAAAALRPVLGPGHEAELASMLEVIPRDVLMVGMDLRPTFVHELHVGNGKRSRLLAALLARETQS